jgi:hypothetical protein
MEVTEKVYYRTWNLHKVFIVHGIFWFPNTPNLIIIERNEENAKTKLTYVKIKSN